MGAMSVGVVGLIRTTESNELEYTPSKSGMNVGGGASVETGIVHYNNLAIAVIVGGVDHDMSIDDCARNVIEQLDCGYRFDVAHLIDSSKIGKVAFLYVHTDLVAAHFQVVGIDASGGGDLGFGRRVIGVNILMQYNINVVRGARRKRTQVRAANTSGL